MTEYRAPEIDYDMAPIPLIMLGVVKAKDGFFGKGSKLTLNAFKERMPEVVDCLSTADQRYTQNYHEFVSRENPLCLCAMGVLLVDLWNARPVRVNVTGEALQWALNFPFDIAPDLTKSIGKEIAEWNDSGFFDFKKIAAYLHFWYLGGPDPRPVKS